MSAVDPVPAPEDPPAPPPPPTVMSMQESTERYQRALQVLQTGVTGGAPGGRRGQQDLQVTVSCVSVGVSALVRVLVAKGVFSQEEYSEALALEMENETQRQAEGGQ